MQNRHQQLSGALRLVKRLPVLLLALVSLPVFAQTYPAKPVRLVVPWPPGGGIDTVARAVGQKLTESLGQPFIVDNRAGATGMIGAEFVSKAAPDGYTLLAATVPIIFTSILYPKIAYDPLKDFAPISLLITVPYYLVVHPSVPSRNVKELIALARAKPGQLTFASPGAGSGGHLLGELLKLHAKVDMLHVPYKGTAPALNDTIGGQTQVLFSDPSAVPLIRAGRLRGLAVTTARRSSTLPELPTLVESGLSQFDVSNWYALLAPAGLSADIVQRLSSEVSRIFQQKDVQDRLFGLGLDPVASTPQALGTLMKEEHARWTTVIKAAKITAD